MDAEIDENLKELALVFCIVLWALCLLILIGGS